MYLFTEPLNNWDDWHKIKTSILAFTPLITYIMQKEKLPLADIKNTMPGTNAVFRVGEYAVKIFAPSELHGVTHKGYGIDVNVELFGIQWANDRGVPSPTLVASGVVDDRHSFRYMIMNYVHGIALDKIKAKLSYEDKVKIGRNVRNITNKLNLPCENFTPIDIMEFAINNDEWKNEGFPKSFLDELSTFLKEFHMGQKVYCHGDFHEGNILVDNSMNVTLVDFADSMYAPAEYELVYIVSSLFGFEKPYMDGYFGENYLVDDILELCMTWLPIHAWSHGMLAEIIGPAETVASFSIMRERLKDWIEKGKEIVSSAYNYAPS